MMVALVWLMERGGILWLEARQIALTLLAGPQADPIGGAALAIVLALRLWLVFVGPVAIAGVGVWGIVTHAPRYFRRTPPIHT